MIEPDHTACGDQGPGTFSVLRRGPADGSRVGALCSGRSPNPRFCPGSSRSGAQS